jgi:YVTN family beta-propeller protein
MTIREAAELAGRSGGNRQIKISRTCVVLALVLATLSAGCGRRSQSSYLVYVTNEASGDLTVIDPNQPEAVATIPLGKRPRGIRASGGLLYVTLSGSPFAPPGVDESTLPPPDRSADGIGVVDPRQNRLVNKIYAGSDPEQFALSLDGKTLYASNEDASSLSIVDVASGKLITTLPTGEEPEGVTLSPDGKFVYVTSENDGTVSVVDTAAAKVVKTLKVGRRPRSVEFLPDASRAFVTNENDATLTVIDAVRQEPRGTIPLAEGSRPMGMVTNKDGSKLYVTTGRGKKVLVLDTATEKIIASFEVGQRPWGIALSPDEALLFTANGPSNDVSVVEVSSGSVIRKVKAGDRPWGVITLQKK